MIIKSLKFILPLFAAMSFSQAVYAHSNVDGMVGSFDFCADQYVLSVVEFEKIYALSLDAIGEYSHLRDMAKSFARHRPDVERVLVSDMSFIVRQWGGSPQMMEQLRSFGITTLQLEAAMDFSAIVNNINKVADVLNKRERASRLVSKIESERMRLSDNASSLAHVNALYVTPGGVTAGSHTFIDSIFKEAGVTNLAAKSGIKGWAAYPIEKLVLDPPDLLVIGFFNARSEKVSNWSVARHPVLQKLLNAVPTIELPIDLISCAGPDSIRAATYLQRAVLDKLDKKD